MRLTYPEPELLPHLANAHAVVSRALKLLEPYKSSFGGEPPGSLALLAARKWLVWSAVWRPVQGHVASVVISVLSAVAAWGAARLAMISGVAAEWIIVTIAIVAGVAIFVALEALDQVRVRMSAAWRLGRTPTDVRLPSAAPKNWASTSQHVTSLCHLALKHIDKAARQHLQETRYPDATRTGSGLSWLARKGGVFKRIGATQQNVCLALLHLADGDSDTPKAATK